MSAAACEWSRISFIELRLSYNYDGGRRRISESFLSTSQGTDPVKKLSLPSFNVPDFFQFPKLNALLFGMIITWIWGEQTVCDLKGLFHEAEKWGKLRLLYACNTLS